MAKEFIVGRAGNQPFKIKADGVSSQHVKITIRSDGWFLEDLNSQNGTFIKDDCGVFHHVFVKKISENTVIRLGTGGHHSFTFMAHRLIATEDDYSYEFHELRKLYACQLEAEAKRERINSRNGWIAKCSGFGVMAVCLLFKMDPMLRSLCIAGSPIVVGLLFKNDSDKLKTVKLRRKNVIVCPKCGRPLSDFDMENMQCSACMAK